MQSLTPSISSESLNLEEKLPKEHKKIFPQQESSRLPILTNFGMQEDSSRINKPQSSSTKSPRKKNILFESQNNRKSRYSVKGENEKGGIRVKIKVTICLYEPT